MVLSVKNGVINLVAIFLVNLIVLNICFKRDVAWEWYILISLNWYANDVLILCTTTAGSIILKFVNKLEFTIWKRFIPKLQMTHQCTLAETNSTNLLSDYCINNALLQNAKDNSNKRTGT